MKKYLKAMRMSLAYKQFSVISPTFLTLILSLMIVSCQQMDVSADLILCNVTMNDSTLWPAYGSFMEDRVGSIKEGKLADFTILDKDIMTIPEEEVLDTKVEMTIIGGEIVYARNGQ